MGGFVDELHNELGNFIDNLQIIDNGDELRIAGVLHFYSHFDPSTNSFHYLSTEKDNPYYIKDKYHILVVFDKNRLPVVKETGGRLTKTSRVKEISLGDMHYPGEIACLGSPDKLYSFFKEVLDTSKIVNFFHFLVIPFYYAQSYMQHNNGKWPWRNLEHGIVGLIEEFAFKPNDLLFLLIKKSLHSPYNLPGQLPYRINQSIMSKLQQNLVRSHRPCICRSGRKTRNCHPHTIEGLRSIKSYVPISRKLRTTKNWFLMK